jgi:hypothetical protein
VLAAATIHCTQSRAQANAELQSRGIEVQHFPHDLAMQLEEMNREFDSRFFSRTIPTGPRRCPVSGTGQTPLDRGPE